MSEMMPLRPRRGRTPAVSGHSGKRGQEGRARTTAARSGDVRREPTGDAAAAPSPGHGEEGITRRLAHRPPRLSVRSQTLETARTANHKGTCLLVGQEPKLLIFFPNGLPKAAAEPSVNVPRKSSSAGSGDPQSRAGHCVLGPPYALVSCSPHALLFCFSIRGLTHFSVFPYYSSFSGKKIESKKNANFLDICAVTTSTVRGR